MIAPTLVLFLLPQEAQDLTTLQNAITPQALRSTVEHLAAYNTRNTLSPTLKDAAEWVASEFRKIPKMEVEVMEYIAPKGRRVPEDKKVVQVIATLPGTTDRRILMGGHLDSLNLQVPPETGRAPGANDDASGVAATLEVARAMAAKTWRHTLVFVAFSGEEQGLLGSKALAERAKSEQWKLDAVLSNDTVGSSGNKSGQSDPHHVRVFSDEAETHQARELARLIEAVTRGAVPDFGVKLVFRKDRYGRGGDHTPFADLGFSAVRFIEVHEEFSRQHTPDDLPEFMDWDYLARVAKTNLVAMAALANAQDPPTEVRIDLRQGHDTTVRWKATPGVKYVVYWRETTSPTWNASIPVGETSEHTVKLVNKDDHIFAVGAEGGIPVSAK